MPATGPRMWQAAKNIVSIINIQIAVQSSVAVLALHCTKRMMHCSCVLLCAPPHAGCVRANCTQTLTPHSFPALCKDDANGNVPLGKSCNR